MNITGVTKVIVRDKDGKHVCMIELGSAELIKERGSKDKTLILQQAKPKV